MERWTEDGIRMCDDEGCDSIATHTLVWTEKWQCYCMIHAQGMINIGQHLGFQTPRLTVRPMQIDEMVKDIE